MDSASVDNDILRRGARFALCCARGTELALFFGKIISLSKVNFESQILRGRFIKSSRRFFI
jgi:hypothetical protein